MLNYQRVQTCEMLMLVPLALQREHDLLDGHQQRCATAFAAKTIVRIKKSWFINRLYPPVLETSGF